jgi:hypothetical protein
MVGMIKMTLTYSINYRAKFVACSVINAVLLCLYGFFVYDTYSRYFIFPLKFVEPVVASAPEDILGLGFYLYWLIFSLIEVYLIYLGAKLSRTSIDRLIVGTLSMVFIVISVIDYTVYNALYDAVVH